ncbi:hypothetical protein CHS0354_021620, partial [Potamilus streckersoni]
MIQEGASHQNLRNQQTSPCYAAALPRTLQHSPIHMTVSSLHPLRFCCNYPATICRSPVTMYTPVSTP